MRTFEVKIELDGTPTLIGHIVFENTQDARFAYDREYLESGIAAPISVSLPLREEAFSPQETKNFFDGLLPEGFTRSSVADWMHVDTNDYLGLLCGLGKECLGAVQITDGSGQEQPDYEELSVEQVRELAREGTVKSAQVVAKSHLSLTGASGKVGLYYDDKNDLWYQPVGSAPSTHIVKQNHVRLREIVLNEQLALTTASLLGVEVPHSFILNTGAAKEEDILLAVERYDRTFDGAQEMIGELPRPRRLHQEDFAQALGIAAEDKYEKDREGYLDRIFELLRRYSSNPIEDQLKLWKLLIFDYLIGNTDNHIKNYSLLYGRDLRSIRLAPAYDLLSTTIYEESTRDMAFRIGGEYSIDLITESCFEAAAQEAGLGRRLAMRCYEELCGGFEKALGEAANRLTGDGFSGAEALREKILLTGGMGGRP